jgi:dTDP-4-amino-4,6-dideoxygalactose transaminase
MATKTRLRDLALFGGPPAFTEPLRVGTPNVGDRQKLRQRLDDALDRRVLTNDGPLVQEFEKQVAAISGVQHAVAVSNATVGLQVAAQALGVSGEVIVPAFTFAGTAHALEWIGLRPVFADVRPDSHTLDPVDAEMRITSRTSALLGVHLWGRPCDTGSLDRLARKYGLHVLYDAAHAFACTHEGQGIGCFGNAAVFSFHATKFINALEGGAVVTSNAEVAERARLMRNFGFADYDCVVTRGTNAKMNEFSAAAGLTALESLDDFLAVNARNHAEYLRGLEGVPGLTLVPYDERERCNRQYVVVDIDADKAGIDRDTLQRLLWAENVLARRYFFPGCHRVEPYRSRDVPFPAHFPVTEQLASRLLQLPTGTAIGPEAIASVCGLIQLAVAHGGKIPRTIAHPRVNAPRPGDARRVG